jgi:hypothetical protein
MHTYILVHSALPHASARLMVQTTRGTRLRVTLAAAIIITLCRCMTHRHSCAGFDCHRITVTVTPHTTLTAYVSDDKRGSGAPAIAAHWHRDRHGDWQPEAPS